MQLFPARYTPPGIGSIFNTYNKSWEDPGDKGRLCSGGDVAAYSDLDLIPRLSEKRAWE